MSEPLRGVIVSHSAVAQALRAAVAATTGIGDALVPVSNDGCDWGALTMRLAGAIGGRPRRVCPPLARPSRPAPPRPASRGHARICPRPAGGLAMLLDSVRC